MRVGEEKEEEEKEEDLFFHDEVPDATLYRDGTTPHL